MPLLPFQPRTDTSCAHKTPTASPCLGMRCQRAQDAQRQGEMAREAAHAVCPALAGLVSILVLLLAAGTGLAPASARAQAFSNLDFEAATVVPGTPFPGLLNWALAAPGWGHSAGADAQGVYYPNTHVGTTQSFLLVDMNNRPGSLLAGSYSLSFASGYSQSNAPQPQWVNASLQQTGLVPVGTQSLRLLATGPLAVWAGNTPLNLVPLGGAAWAADISAFAGQTVELKFANTALQLFTPVTLDSIQFSAVAAVAEPATRLLSCLGLCALWSWLRPRQARGSGRATA